MSIQSVFWQNKERQTSCLIINCEIVLMWISSLRGILTCKSTEKRIKGIENLKRTFQTDTSFDESL